MIKIKLVMGVGINDANYPVSKVVKGKTIRCEYYRRWLNMLTRCYSRKYQENQPTYKKCTVSTEWLQFSNFKDWMRQQDWVEKDLDKDILVEGNLIYSKETCAFVSRRTNTFFYKSCTPQVCKLTGKYIVYGRTLKGKQVNLGGYTTIVEATKAYITHKKSVAKELITLESDIRIINILEGFIKDEL